jgi:hypothetical protein
MRRFEQDNTVLPTPAAVGGKTAARRRQDGGKTAAERRPNGVGESGLEAGVGRNKRR